MAKKKSSFHMGDEFNGSGKKTYLRATQHNTYAPLPQHNVRLTPNFNKFVPVAIGGLPIGIEATLEESDDVIKATGSISNVLQVIVEAAQETRKWLIKFEVQRRALTTGAYLFSNDRNQLKLDEFEEHTIEELSDLEQYIKDIITKLGWTTNDEEVKEIISILEVFQITDKNSIACFLLLSISEAGSEGLYTGKVGKDGKPVVDEYERAVTEYYPDNYHPGYDFEERGVGYMQVTFKESQEACLEYLIEKGYYNEEVSSTIDYIEELRKKPWQTSAWRWAVYGQTGWGNLNAYIEAKSTENEDKLTLGMVLTAECFINGKVSSEKNPPVKISNNPKEEYSTINNALAGIASGIIPQIKNDKLESYWYTQGEYLYVCGWKYKAPNNWPDFVDNYIKLFPME